MEVGFALGFEYGSDLVCLIPSHCKAPFCVKICIYFPGVA